MQIWPAIDLRGGKCVRLRQGDYDRETVFEDDPVVAARRWMDAGAEFLHLVDLDGARDGRVTNRPAVERIVRSVDAVCELGGGVRDKETIRELLDLGLTRLVIGTRALKEPEWFRSVCREFPGKLVLGIDARDSLVATDGWLDTSATPAVELAVTFEREPLAAIVYTDIATDGMMAGPNFAAMQQMQQATAKPVVASGGVTTLDDVTRLAEIGMAGCIIGRTLYEGRLDLAEAIAAVKS